jgi:hypothetical protein
VMIILIGKKGQSDDNSHRENVKVMVVLIGKLSK